MLQIPLFFLILSKKASVMKYQRNGRINYGRFLFLLMCLPFTISSFDTRSQTIDSLSGSEILSMSLEDLMNLEITTATKVSQKMQEVPATVRIITHEQIRERGYFTLEQIFADLPGFQFRNINGFNSYSFLRGLPSQNNLILLLVDGIQINELNSGGYYGGGQFNLANIERIEVVYGPSSALYGTNAISGIVNIITKKPESGSAGQISGSVGNFRTSQLDASYAYAHPGRDLSFRLAGMYKTTEKADLREEAGDNNWTDNMENFEDDYSLDGYFKFKNLTAGVTTQLKQSSRTTSYKSIGAKYLDRGSYWNIWFLNAYLGYTYDRKKTWSNSSRIYTRNATVLDNSVSYVLKADSTFPGDQVGNYRPNWLLGVENQFNYFPKEYLFFIAGVTYEHEAVSQGFSVSHSNNQDIRPPAPPKPGTLNNDLLSLYVQGQVWFLKYFQLMAGARQDFSSYYHNVFTPRVALVFNWNDLTVKALYNEGFRAPRPWDYTDGVGNDNLKPEKMKAAELALSYTFRNVLSLEVSAYRNWLTDMLTIDYIDTLGNWKWVNNDRVTVTGIETGLTVQLQRLNLTGHYTWCDPTDQNGNLIPEISRHTANLGVTWNFFRNWHIDLRGYYYGDRLNNKVIAATGTDRIDDAFLVNGTLSWFSRPGLDLQLVVNNVLNTKYYHPSNLTPDRYRQPQRTVMVKATWTFDFQRNEKK